MSSSIPKKSNKSYLNTKRKKIKIAPFYINTIASSNNKNTFIMNSCRENFYKFEKMQYSSRNLSLKRDKLDFIPKEKNIKQNIRNISLKHMIINKFIRAREYSCKNKDNKNKSKIMNNSNNHYKNDYRKTNYKLKNNKQKDKNSLIILNKISWENTKSLKTFRLSIDNIFKEKFNKKVIKNKFNNTEKNISKNKTKKFNKTQTKCNNSLNKVSSNNVNKKGISRNPNLKLQTSSIRNINSKLDNNSLKTNIDNYNIKNSTIRNNNQTDYTTKVSCANSLNKNKEVYHKKKVENSFKFIDTNKSKQKPRNKNSGNYLSNHNYLVNLILENKKVETNKKYNLYSMIKENKRFNSLNKKFDSKLLIDKNENINNLLKRELSKKYESKYDKSNESNVKKIVINKKNNNKILRKFKSVEQIKLIDKDKKSKINNNNRNKKNNIKTINNNEVKNNNSIINLGKKDSFLDMLETNLKYNKEKNERETKINNIKINEFNVKKPKEENMKFTLLKNRYDEESNNEEINKSEIIIGTIEGYKDIIENDKLNNNFFRQDNSINVFESNTLDNNSFSKKINKKILQNFIVDEKDYNEKNKKNNDIDGLEIFSSNTNGFILNDSEINSILNYVEDDNNIGDLSTTILKINKKYKNNCLYPYHVNIIYFVKKYDNETRKYIIQESINNDNILLVDNNKLSLKKNIDNNEKDNYNKKVKSVREYKKDDIIKFMSKFKLNSKNKKNNIVQKSCNLFIEGNNKKCIIF